MLPAWGLIMIVLGVTWGMGWWIATGLVVLADSLSCPLGGGRIAHPVRMAANPLKLQGFWLRGYWSAHLMPTIADRRHSRIKPGALRKLWRFAARRIDIGSTIT